MISLNLYSNISYYPKTLHSTSALIFLMTAKTPIAAPGIANANVSNALSKKTPAIAPIVEKESINFEKAFYQNRYNKGEACYINCPMTKEEWTTFYIEFTTVYAQKQYQLELRV